MVFTFDDYRMEMVGTIEEKEWLDQYEGEHHCGGEGKRWVMCPEGVPHVQAALGSSMSRDKMHTFRMIKDSCGRTVCRVCGPAVIEKRTDEVYRRMKGGKRAYEAASGRSMGQEYELIISVPRSWYDRYGTRAGQKDLNRWNGTMARKIGMWGFVDMFHAVRGNEAILDSVRYGELAPVFSPHYHNLGVMPQGFRIKHDHFNLMTSSAWERAYGRKKIDEYLKLPQRYSPNMEIRWKTQDDWIAYHLQGHPEIDTQENRDTGCVYKLVPRKKWGKNLWEKINYELDHAFVVVVEQVRNRKGFERTIEQHMPVNRWHGIFGYNNMSMEAVKEPELCPVCGQNLELHEHQDHRHQDVTLSQEVMKVIAWIASVTQEALERAVRKYDYKLFLSGRVNVEIRQDTSSELAIGIKVPERKLSNYTPNKLVRL
ncbi:MAG: hypothetical protein A4E28_00021 [Methanocella sp. PtaU1.Bin125]|nr:MAG: hypothetical protein A4E28_00021 [Methanocella sp. PtaU1.Bin125]